MSIETTIQNEIKSLINFSDAIISEGKNISKVLNDLSEQIIEGDSKGENVDDLIKQQRVLMPKSFLAEQDLVKCLSQLNVLYKVATTSKLELSLGEEDVKRLDYNLTNDSYIFVLEKGRIQFKNSMIMEGIENKINSTSDKLSKSEYINALKLQKANGSK